MKKILNDEIKKKKIRTKTGVNPQLGINNSNVKGWFFFSNSSQIGLGNQTCDLSKFMECKTNKNMKPNSKSIRC